MSSLYEITSDLLALDQLLDGMVTEDGEPREPTDEEMETMKQWFLLSESEFEKKIDNYCKFIKNLKVSADNADTIRKNMSAEMTRLSKRSTAFENRAKALQGLLRWNMDRLKIKKYKTDLFSLNIQNTQKIINTSSTCDMSKIPEEFLKPRELDKTAVKNALSDGTLIQKDGDLYYGRVFFANGEELDGVTCIQGTALVIR